MKEELSGNDFVQNTIAKIVDVYGVEILSDYETAATIFRQSFTDNNELLNLILKILYSGMMDRFIIDIYQPLEVLQENLSVGIKYLVECYGIEYHQARFVATEVLTGIRKSFHGGRGKTICRQLKEMRMLFARENGIPYEEATCTNTNPCNGTCSYCDSKTRELYAKAQQMNKEIIYPFVDINNPQMSKSG